MQVRKPAHSPPPHAIIRAAQRRAASQALHRSSPKKPEAASNPGCPGVAQVRPHTCHMCCISSWPSSAGVKQGSTCVHRPLNAAYLAAARAECMLVDECLLDACMGALASQLGLFSYGSYSTVDQANMDAFMPLVTQRQQRHPEGATMPSTGTTPASPASPSSTSNVPATQPVVEEEAASPAPTSSAQGFPPTQPVDDATQVRG